MTRYRQSIGDQICSLVRPLGPLESVLDYGSGDGFFAAHWRRSGLADTVVPVDVVRRANSIVTPVIYDGERLPFSDRSFDLAYAIDVLHHCPQPWSALADLSRCARRYLLIKDHSYRSQAGRIALAALDELGNRRFGIPSPYQYQKNWEWIELIESTGWNRLKLICPMKCHAGLIGALTNHLQFIGLWERMRA